MTGQAIKPTRRGCLQRGLALVSALLVASLALPVQAAEDVATARVGRISQIIGTIEASNEMGSLPAVLNLPVSSGLQLRVPAQSRAELRIGSLALHLGPTVILEVQALQDDRLSLVLDRGPLALHPRTVSAGQVQRVQVGTVGVQLLAPGSYRILHQPLLHRVEVAVFEGSLSLETPAGTSSMTSGQLVVIDPRSGLPIEQGRPERKGFDDWASQRVQRYERGGAGPRTLSAELTGGEVLDETGTWRVDPRVGPVWVPRGVDADWAPFRYGRWVWIAPWGWNWVDDAPWGFATSHYGRWAFAAGRWGWVPGTSAATPVYAPALVGFLSVASGGTELIGWYPLGPGEAYRPSYPIASRLRQALEGGAAPRGADNRHRYAQTSFAASAVGRERFGAAAPAGSDRVTVTPSELSGASPLAANALPPAPAPTPLTPPPALRAASSARPALLQRAERQRERLDRQTKRQTLE